jgi:hypothetical protein
MTVTGTVPERTLSTRSTLFKKAVLGFVVMLLISSSGLLRYGIKGILKLLPAMTVWIGFAPEADGDGATLGEPEAGDPGPEDGNTFEVGITGGDTADVPASLAEGDRGVRDAVEGAAGLGVDDGAPGGPLVGPAETDGAEGLPVDPGGRDTEEPGACDDAGEDAGGAPLVDTTLLVVAAREGELVCIGMVDDS